MAGKGGGHRGAPSCHHCASHRRQQMMNEAVQGMQAVKKRALCLFSSGGWEVFAGWWVGEQVA